MSSVLFPQGSTNHPEVQLHSLGLKKLYEYIPRVLFHSKIRGFLIFRDRCHICEQFIKNNMVLGWNYPSLKVQDQRYITQICGPKSHKHSSTRTWLLTWYYFPAWSTIQFIYWIAEPTYFSMHVCLYLNKWINQLDKLLYHFVNYFIRRWYHLPP